MWIKIKEIFNVGIFRFIKDEIRDTTYIPAGVVKQFPKGSFEKTSAPWELQVDKAAVEKQAAADEYNRLRSESTVKFAAAKSANSQAAQTDQTLKAATKAAQKLASEAKKAAKDIELAKNTLAAKKSTAKEKQSANDRTEKANRTIRESAKAELNVVICTHLHKAAEAQSALAYLEYYDAKEKTDAAKKQAGLATEPANATAPGQQADGHAEG